jgi:phospholipase/carboxylesterase
LAARTRYSFTRAPVAIGFSNGAIMAAALLLTLPSLLGAPFYFSRWDRSPCRSIHLDDKPVLIIDGEKDTRRVIG